MAAILDMESYGKIIGKILKLFLVTHFKPPTLHITQPSQLFLFCFFAAVVQTSKENVEV